MCIKCYGNVPNSCCNIFLKASLLVMLDEKPVGPNTVKPLALLVALEKRSGHHQINYLGIVNVCEKFHDNLSIIGLKNTEICTFSRI